MNDITKVFNTTGYCDPEIHYMVDLSERLRKIRSMIDAEQYFTINRARQYGKTTVLTALADYLRTDYDVISLDFQGISNADFASEQSFVAAFSRQMLLTAESLPDRLKEQLTLYAAGTMKEATLSVLFLSLLELCRDSDKGIVLIIDEVDSATNNQVFIDFLAQLRFYYLKRRKIKTFQSVILAGVYDVRNIKRKIRPEEEHKKNSPWNIAAKFRIDMGFDTVEIRKMLEEYEADHHVGMNVDEISELIYDYSSGYPYLVSAICKYMDEEIACTSGFPDKKAAWTKTGFLEAIKMLLNETNPLFQSLKGKLEDYPKLKSVLYDLLFTGRPVPYTAQNEYIEIAEMLGFIKNRNGSAVISNRIFETVLYNWFMSEEYVNSKIYDVGAQEKSQFTAGGHLNVRRILEKFVESFDSLYGDLDETFLEDVGRRYFLLFLKPIINGIGNSYVEPETRNRERMDLVIDYHGEQFIIELKVWRGNAYNERGEKQLSDYLDYFHLKTGYMLSFNFNRTKEIGLKDIVLGDRRLIEAVV